MPSGCQRSASAPVCAAAGLQRTAESQLSVLSAAICQAFDESTKRLSQILQGTHISSALLSRLQSKEAEIDALLQTRRSQLPAAMERRSLPANAKSQIEKLMAAGGHPLCIVGKYEIGTAEANRLLENEWLNDQIIDGYLHLLAKGSTRKAYSFSCFIYLKLASNAYEDIRNFTKRCKIDVFSHQLLLFPVSLGSHWCLGVVDFERQAMLYYDSLGGAAKHFFKNISYFIEQEAGKSTGKLFDWTGWKHQQPTAEIPHQKNGFDCGMFVLAYAECICANRAMSHCYSQKDMQTFRIRVLYELLTGSLLP